MLHILHILNVSHFYKNTKQSEPNQTKPNTTAHTTPNHRGEAAPTPHSPPHTTEGRAGPSVRRGKRRPANVSRLPPIGGVWRSLPASHHIRSCVMRHRPPLPCTAPSPPDGMVFVSAAVPLSPKWHGPCLGEELPQSLLKPKELRTLVSCALSCAS